MTRRSAPFREPFPSSNPAHLRQRAWTAWDHRTRRAPPETADDPRIFTPPDTAEGWRQTALADRAHVRDWLGHWYAGRLGGEGESGGGGGEGG